MPASKEQIADAFQRHVLRHGFAKASVEDVAAELGISKKTIYQHYGSKAELYGFIVDRIAEGERVRLEALVSRRRTWKTKTRMFLETVITGMREHIQETSKADWLQEFEIAYDAMARAYGALGTELVAGGVTAGEFAPQDPVLANEMIGAMITRYGVLVREDARLDKDTEIVDAIMRMLGGGAGREGK